MIKIYNLDLTEIHKSAQIGDGTRIGSFTLIHADVIIGEGCVIGSHCNICEGVRIGRNVSIQTGCHITRGVIIGNDTFIGPGVITMNDKYMKHGSHTTLEEAFNNKLISPKIGCRSKIGGGSKILPGVIIGDDVLIGAGSVVTKNMPNGSKAWGNPARIKGMTNECLCFDSSL